MQARMIRRTAFVLGVLLLIFSIPVMAAERHALVIGNAAYPEQPRINTVNDADDLAAKLGRLGFDVTKLTNLGLRDLARAITDFVHSNTSTDLEGSIRALVRPLPLMPQATESCFGFAVDGFFGNHIVLRSPGL